jgi:DNA-binding Xre family transcriptional regulator
MWFLKEGKMRKISYDPLFKKLVDVKMNRTELSKKAGISKGTMTKIGKNEYIAMEIIEKLCNVLDCDIVDIVSCIPADDASED